ncbi:MBL fold metallo-hydrolase [Oceanobacillus kimchii]|uniref:MBL fold metallo-hydrolase n=1 Tax=Oceanobacillus kimchii TaxID=746691 RepID=UPI003B0201D9
MRKKIVLVLSILLFLIGCGDTHTSEANNSSNLPIENGNLKVHFIDVKQADATLFSFISEDENYAVLFDTGDWQGVEVVPYLQEQNISHLDLVIISHPDADHIGQLTDVIENIQVDEVWMSGNESTSQTYLDAMEAILDQDITYQEPRTGEEYTIGPLDIEILYPETISGKSNEESVSIRLDYDEVSFVLTGDAGKQEELEMIESTESLDSTVLHLGHHGSDTSSDADFVREVNPELAIYSAGQNNSYGHPSEEVIRLLNNKDIEWYGTDVNGTIIVETDGQEYSVQMERSHDNSKSECVNINESTIEDLQEIVHIGSSRAERMVDERPFESLQELDVIEGIGPSRIADIEEQGIICSL